MFPLLPNTHTHFLVELNYNKMCGGSWHTYVVAVAFVCTIVTCGAPAWLKRDIENGVIDCDQYLGPWGYVCTGECEPLCKSNDYNEFANVADYEQFSDEENAWRGGTALAVPAGGLALIANAAVYCQESPSRCQCFIVLFFTLLAVLGTIISIGAFDELIHQLQPGVDRVDLDRSDYFVCFGLQVVAFVFFSISSLWDLKGLLCGARTV
jgi:hypothetical protein